MWRYGLAPSDDVRWEQIAETAIAAAEAEDVDLREFYQGLVAIMNSLEARLSVANSELNPDEES